MTSSVEDRSCTQPRYFSQLSQTMSMALKTLEQCAAEHCLSLQTLLEQSEKGFGDWLKWTKNNSGYDAIQQAVIRCEWRRLKYAGGKKPEPILNLQALSGATCLSQAMLNALTSSELESLALALDLSLIERSAVGRELQGLSTGYSMKRATLVAAAAPDAMPNGQHQVRAMSLLQQARARQVNAQRNFEPFAAHAQHASASNRLASRHNGSERAHVHTLKAPVAIAHAKSVSSLSTTKSVSKQAVTVRTVAKKKPIQARPEFARDVNGRRDASVSMVKYTVEEKICMALAELHALGIFEACRSHVALFSNYTHVRSTGFAQAFSVLKTKGMVVFASKGTIRLTASGKAVTPTVNPPKSNAEMLLRLQPVVKKACGKHGCKSDLICDLLSDGQAHAVESVLTACGYTHVRSTGFAKVLSVLTSLGLIEKMNGAKFIMLADIAFPYGRPGAVSVKCSRKRASA